MHAEDWLLAFVAILLPPVPVIVKRGFCSAELLISIFLLILGFLPSLIYGWYIISKYPRTEYLNLDYSATYGSV